MVGVLSASLLTGAHSHHPLQDLGVGEDGKNKGKSAGLAGIEIWSTEYGLVHSFHPDDCILQNETAQALCAAFPAGPTASGAALGPREALFLVDHQSRCFLRHPANPEARPPFPLSAGYREMASFETPLRPGLRLLQRELFGFLAALPTSGCRGLASGTQLACEHGPEAIEAVRPGTRVHTPSGLQTVLAIARTPLSPTVMTCFPRFAPMVFPANALGNPDAFTLAPDQGIRVGGPNVEYDFGETEVLVSAREFAPLSRAFTDRPATGFTYYNLILAEPEPVNVGGLWTETVNLSTISPEWLPRMQAAGLLSALSDCPLQALMHLAPAARHLRRFEAQSLLYELTRDGGAISRAAFAIG
ncbi:hypothetical protein PSA7680_03473 [Pseudoruegeria aquimaris]|uniref:Hedgehog/Intein (Hint) domain-containing protein n=1 Tax=Pseudoruegeria aquimaris TaxID=393663 RepID=A0A1Y5TJY0_9RHOB|nr:Hint domain-containing protein [Pseudoruegeria aquimaris]SLN65831.1 hypothetical protein PSA7680_03473 [Pseudoruegeria aquimaris]